MDNQKQLVVIGFGPSGLNSKIASMVHSRTNNNVAVVGEVGQSSHILRVPPPIETLFDKVDNHPDGYYRKFDKVNKRKNF